MRALREALRIWRILKEIARVASDIGAYRALVARRAREGDLDAAFLVAKRSDRKVRDWLKRKGG